MENFEVPYWDTLVKTLSSAGYMFFTVIVSLGLLTALICILVNGRKYDWRFKSIVGWASLVFGLAIFVLGAGLIAGTKINQDNLQSDNINQVINKKYNLDLFERYDFEKQDNGALQMKAKIASYEHGVSKGYGSYESRTDRRKDLVNIAIDADGVPYILPWDGVDKDFVELLER